MKKITEIWNTLRSRWRNAMPIFFKRMMWLGGLMSGTAIAVHEVFDHYGIVADGWWLFVERYLIGVGVGIVFACKFTQTYGKNGEPIRKGLEPTNPSSVNNSDMEVSQPGDDAEQGVEDNQ